MATSNNGEEDDPYSCIEGLYTDIERTDPPDKSNFREKMLIFKEETNSELQTTNKDLIRNVKNHIIDLINQISLPLPEKITSQQEAEEISYNLQEINKKMHLIGSIPDDIREIQNDAKLTHILKHDINILNEETVSFVNLCKSKISEHNQALNRVIKANEQHETRSTSSIIKGTKNIPEHFFLNTPLSKKKGKSQLLPWQCTDEKKEDEKLEAALVNNEKESAIIKYAVNNQLINTNKDATIETIIQEFNERLANHDICLNQHDEELERKIKHLHINNIIKPIGAKNIHYETMNKLNTQSNNYTKHQEIDETMYYTPKKSDGEGHQSFTNHLTHNQSHYYTPQEATLHTPVMHNLEFTTPRKPNWDNLQTNTQDTSSEEHNNTTKLSDLLRFQQEANFPSVRSRLESKRIGNNRHPNAKSRVSFTEDNSIKRNNFYSANNEDQNVKNHNMIQVNPQNISPDDNNIMMGHLSKQSGKDMQHRYYSSIPNANLTTPSQIQTYELSKSIINRIRKLEIEMDDLEESTDSVDRIIKRIKNISNFTFQELQDLSPKLTEYNKIAKNHRKAQIDFKKEFIDIEEAVLKYDRDLFELMTNASDLATAKAREIAKSLKAAEDRILDEQITGSNVSTQDSKEIIYSDFNAGNSISDKNIYEVIKNHESNHKLNRTSNYLKGIILKKHLKGNAKLSISEDLTNYDEVKNALIKRYGNVNELLSSLYNHHTKIGQTPPRTGSNVQWGKINETCKGHLMLLRRADLLLKNANDNVVNEKYVTDLIKFLCQEDRYDILSMKGNPEDAYKALKKKFTTTLDMSQEMLRLNPKHTTLPKKRSEEYQPGNSEFGLVTNYELTIAKDCNVCQKLQELGNMQDFFENHLQNKNTGSFYNAQCPLYLKMTMKERLDFLKQNQMCVYCVNPLNANHKVEICHQKNLNIRNGRRPPYTCRTPNCPNRLELCMIHKETNMNALLKRKENLYQNNIEMCLISTVENDEESTCSTHISYEKQASIEKVKQWLKNEEHNQVQHPEFNHVDQNQTINENELPPWQNIQDKDRPLLVQHKETLLKNEDVLALNGQSKPIFLFMKLKGHTRGVTTMFDSGSSAVVCTDSIPGKELKACKIPNQAIELQGLGATKRRAQAWTLLLPILQNRYVATTAYSVPHILGPLSPVNLNPAHALIKEAAVNNKEVQRSKIYNYLSGNIELLAGIRLNCLFPEKIFQMTNGLALYRLKLASHNQHKMYCLGGPFEVINEMKEIFHESAHFLNEIDTGLNQWRSGNTAKIERIQYHYTEDSSTEVTDKISSMTEELTNDDLEEIDDFLDNTHTLILHQEAVNIITPQSDNQHHNQSQTSNRSDNFNGQIVIETNKPELQSFIYNRQQDITLNNPTKNSLIPIKNPYIELARINILDWKSSIAGLRQSCKTIELKNNKIALEKHIQAKENIIALMPTPKTRQLIKNIQEEIVSNTEHLDNIIVKISDEANIPILRLKDKNTQANIPNVLEKTPDQTVKEIKIYSHEYNIPNKNRKLIAKIKIKNKGLQSKELINITNDDPLPERKDIKPSSKSDENRCKDSPLLRNLELIIDGPKVGYRCNTCSSCNKCKQNPNQTIMTMKEQLEQYLIEKSVAIDRNNKQFIAKLPLTHNPDETLLPNKNETRIRLKKVLQKLKRENEDGIKIKAAFDKLIDLNYIVKLSELPKRIQDSIASKKIKYYIPWDYVSKPTSITTEKRQVYDASAKTPSGNSLNDILCKGCPKMEFDNVLLNFVSNKYALCGDIMKFYQSVKLHEEHYHLQLILWTDSMDPEAEPAEYVITRLTFGLKSSSQQLEHCVELLAEENKHKENLYRILKEQRYVDDIMGSYSTRSEIEELKNDLNVTLENYGMKIKGFACSYAKPPINISDGTSVITGGYIWQPELDIIFIRIQPLHYAEKKRGKIMTENVFMEGTFKELDQFVPQNLTLRQVLSRGAQIFDPLGLVNPWKTGVKILTRESLESVKKDWDAPLSSEYRERWVKKFWDMQELKRIGFKRNNMPIDGNPKRTSLICFCDAGKHAKVQIVYLLKEMDKSIHHVQMLYSKSQLVQANKTLANMELDSMNNGAEILNKCYNALPNVDRICLVGDSQITSYWIARDTISLATFQRNRVSNIRRLININDIYRCKGTQNIADIGTKGEINIADSIPGSKFHTGPKWLKHGIENAIALGHLIAIKETHIDPNDSSLWKMATDGLVGKCKWPDELLMKKYNEHELPILTINHQWVSQVKERYLFSEYVIDPLKKNWTQIIRIVGIVFYFLHKLIVRTLNKAQLDRNSTKIKRWIIIHEKIFDIKKEAERINFCQTFATMINNETQMKQQTEIQNPLLMCEQIKRSPESLTKSIYTLITTLPNNDTLKSKHILDLFTDGITANFFISIAILYFLRKASKELEVFYKKGMIKKHCYKAGNLYFSKNRWMEANQLRIIDDENISLHDLNIQELAPVLDRHSPVAISLALHFHNTVTKHAGADRSHLAIQGSVFIFQGQKLFEDICRDCITCRIKLKQRYTQIMGPIGQEQITYSAVGRFMYLDMSGPYEVKTSINARNTRKNSNLTKVWLLHGVCIVSSYSVVQVLETYATDSFVQAVHRIASYIGFPQLVFIDSSQTEIKGLTKTNFSMYDTTNQLFDECGITIKLCGVGGKSHSRHGLIERRIALFKKYFEISKQKIADLTPTGLYTLALQAAAHLNAAPLCTKKRNGSTISSRLITPNCFILGKRTNYRSPSNIPYIVEDRSIIMDKLHKAAEGMLSYFQVNIPDLLLRTCHTKESNEQIRKGDLVLFMKDESPMSYNWKMGIVYGLEHDDDKKARILQITYVNKDEIHLPLNKDEQANTSIIKRITRKGIHTVVKLNSIDDIGINSDLAYLNNILQKDPTNINLPEETATLISLSNIRTLKINHENY